MAGLSHQAPGVTPGPPGTYPQFSEVIVWCVRMELRQVPILVSDSDRLAVFEWSRRILIWWSA
jgi:hypothetical protein